MGLARPDYRRYEQLRQQRWPEPSLPIRPLTLTESTSVTQLK
jgi:hypothetical protein